MTALPLGWAEVELGAILTPLQDGRYIHQGWSPQCEKEPRRSEDEWGALKTTAIQGGAYQPEHNKRLPDHLSPRELLEVHRGDLLITSAGPRARCGVPCLVRTTPRRLMISGKMYRFRVSDQFVDARYLEAYLLSSAAERAIDAMKTGISDSGLNLTHKRFTGLRIPLAPLPEQRRIVAAIEEQLSRVDAALDLLKRAERHTQVLVDAEVRSRIEGTDWPVTPLADVALLITDGDHNPPPRVAEGVPHLTAKNIRGGEIRLEGCTFVTQEGFEQTKKRYEPQPGDVIVTCVGTIGETAVVPEGLIFSADRNLAAIRPRAGFDSDYLRFALTSTSLRKQMTQASGSTAQPHLYLRDLRRLPVRIPPLDEQRQVAASLAQAAQRGKHLTSAVRVARARAQVLRRSVLAAAFVGELGRQDPNDEPASVLLERIAFEPAAAPKPARGRRKRMSA